MKSQTYYFKKIHRHRVFSFKPVTRHDFIEAGKKKEGYEDNLNYLGDIVMIPQQKCDFRKVRQKSMHACSCVVLVGQCHDSFGTCHRYTHPTADSLMKLIWCSDYLPHLKKGSKAESQVLSP